MLRLAEGTTSVTTTILTPATPYELKFDPSTATAPFLRPRLENPSAARRYRATGAIDLWNNEAATATITTRIYVSYDEAVSWNQLVFVESYIEQGDRKHCRIDQPLTLGSALADPVPAAAASMMIKLEVESSIANTQFSAPDGDGGTGFLQLTEHI